MDKVSVQSLLPHHTMLITPPPPTHPLSLILVYCLCSIVVRNLGGNPVDFTVAAAMFGVQYGAGGVGVGGAGGMPTLSLPAGSPGSPETGRIYEDNDEGGLTPGGGSPSSPKHAFTPGSPPVKSGGNDKGDQLMNYSPTPHSVTCLNSLT